MGTGRWTQYDEDAYRLPAGVKRTAYDADTGVYTYRDENGQIYRGSPHQRYGTLRPVYQPPADARPMFDKDKARLSVDTKSTGPAPKSFADILSPDKVTSASPIHNGRSPTKSTSPKSRFVDAVRRATAPKMLDVVHHATASHRASFASDSEKQRLIPKDVPRMSEKGPLTRSATSAGHRSSAPLARSATTASTLVRAATSAGHRSSPPVSALARSSTTASSLARSATNASSRSGASLVRSATNASTRSTASTTSLSHLVNAKPMRVDSMKELPSVPTGIPHHSRSSSSSASKRSSSQARRAVEAL